MFKPHQGIVPLRHSFNEAWELLREKGKIHLETERERTPFEVEARITARGKHKGERVIIFRSRKGREHARSYPCCWRSYYNCLGTRIGMYCKALDKFVLS